MVNLLPVLVAITKPCDELKNLQQSLEERDSFHTKRLCIANISHMYTRKFWKNKRTNITTWVIRLLFSQLILRTEHTTQYRYMYMQLLYNLATVLNSWRTDSYEICCCWQQSVAFLSMVFYPWHADYKQALAATFLVLLPLWEWTTLKTG